MSDQDRSASNRNDGIPQMGTNPSLGADGYLVQAFCDR
jgi:hypothetical protein